MFRSAVADHAPLQIAGTINAYCALLAENAGFRAIYLSGSGVASASFGLPDLGLTSLGDVLEDVRRITGAARVPLLVDADTGFGGAFNIARATRELIRAGAAAMHIEDQVQAKRCGHRPNKAVVPMQEMCDRLKAACDARSEDAFVLMARTDAFALEGIDAAIARAQAYTAAGADMIFAEALTSLDDYRAFCSALDVPVLANMTEFGVTPYFSAQQFAAAGVRMVLYPLTAFRAMSQAAVSAYQAIIEHGTQEGVLEALQTREQSYTVLDYHAYERKLDELYARDTNAKEASDEF